VGSVVEVAGAPQSAVANRVVITSLVLARGKLLVVYTYAAYTKPDDIGATVYHVLGIDPSVDVRDRQERPVRLNRGEVMRSLFTGAA